MPSSFEWTTSPEVFNDGFADYTIAVRSAIFAKCVDYAAIIQNWMRTTAPWDDQNMPNREYLRAEAFDNDEEIGIRAWYDMATYNEQADPERRSTGNWGVRHETVNFSRMGVISIILPHPEGTTATVLGDWANDLMDEIRALFAS